MRIDSQSNGLFLAGMKMLYPCPQTRVLTMDIYIYICVYIYVYIFVYVHLYVCINICVYAGGFMLPAGSE